MKYARYIFYGIVFAIILIKVEAISWYRIQEMFLFHSFHMYGVLFSAIGVALLGVQLIKFYNQKRDEKNKIELKKKELNLKANILGGIIFGLGWGITGACPGPIYALIGLDILPAVVVLLGALVGTYFFLIFKRKLLSH
ncbi:MAG: YeeE/YedE family protein [Crocinitomicaceae bacterium]|nr:YeeE/YedE family protein [Crocinitomicaceae bacterium]MBK8925738.1 YeeE/YedE family protein [Crocinitomicaceae bacterium]